MSQPASKPGGAGPMPAASDDASIPMLTERLTLPPLELDTTLPRDASDDADAAGEAAAAAVAPSPAPARPVPPVAPAPSIPATPFALPALNVPAPAAQVPKTPPAPAAAATAPAASGLGMRPPADASAAGAHWTRIELDLRASILSELAQSLPQEVDAIVRSKMSDAIDRFVSQLAAETRMAMAASLRDIVDHAVRAELDRLRGRKR